MILGSHGMLGRELTQVFSDCDTTALAQADLDITDPAALQKKIIQVAPDLIINAAAVNAVDKIEESSEMLELAKKINGEAVGNLAALCREHNIILVHFSSDYVFAGDDKNGYDETAITNPINKYGITKALGEKLLLQAGAKFYLIRLSKLFGRPAVSVGAKKSFVDTMLWLATDEKKVHFDLVDYETSSPTYAPDLAKLTRSIVDAGRPFGIYHGANSGACSWYGFAKNIFALKNIPVEVTSVPPEKFPRPAKRPEWSELINTKLPPQRSWQEALKEYLC